MDGYSKILGVLYGVGAVALAVFAFCLGALVGWWA